MKQDAKILTTIPGVPGKFWGDSTTVVDPAACTMVMYGRRGRLAKELLSLYVAAKLLWKARHFGVVVVDGGPVGRWYTLLRRLFPFNYRPVVMIDCLWYQDGHPLKQAAKRLLMRLSAGSVACFVVWAEHEVDDYSRVFGIPRNKFRYLPFHTTIEDYVFQVADHGYIFAGGNGDRDYRTLIEAVRDTELLVFIAASDERLFSGITVPGNVTIRAVSHEEFREKMAGCRCAVVPLLPGLLHSGGQQTFLNSMAMGKATVVASRKAAQGYIEADVSGLVVESGDVLALREALLQLDKDALLRERLAAAGKEVAEQLTTDAFVRRLYELAQSVVRASGKQQKCVASGQKKSRETRS